MSTNVLDLKTDAALLESLMTATQRSFSMEEKLEQRISFVVSSIDPAKGVTREHIKNVVSEHFCIVSD